MHDTDDVSTVNCAAFICAQPTCQQQPLLTSVPDCCQPSKDDTPGCCSKQKSEDECCLRDAQAVKHSGSVTGAC